MSDVAARPESRAEESPETAYRRGYQQGANDTLMAVERAIYTRLDFSDLRNWIGYSLHAWRHQDKVDDRGVEPPLPPHD